ncbi:LCP family protein [Oenococcus oeni]|uniref:LCP family protein n=2 Tax=Oenococcus oeni TaxID=1247 RepID=UPI000277B9D8|nr:LCP family protein [Oenococcus oeni]EJO02197.1 transcriptional regulator [Oenococcus oeni AWRIB418]KGH59163.1 transcriptional regulator [Oenococcus oeni IOEB_9805]KGH74650.1 transcriptional regulator [Oenococcus oeni IOEB_9803]KGH78713.1 transcriptional regulator [Oenococcus oeni IOEB_8417]KGH88263.1 transcriptional regulator [Oenococcus oeni S12]
MRKFRSPKAGKERRPGRKRKHLIRNIVLTVFGLLFVGVGVIFFVAYSNIKGAIDSNTFVSTNIKKERNVDSVLSKGKPVSILLMGTDTGELGRNWVGRTDSMILVIINPKTKKTLLMSIPRDSMVSIPGYEYTFPQKINAAYEYPANGKGHPETSIKTVEKWLNVPIDFYGIVNMEALEQIVNKAGGISVKSPLTFTFSEDTAHDYGNNLYTFTKGSTKYKYYKNGSTLTKTSNIMNGAAALAFTRMRYNDPLGDYGRTLRQRLVLEAIAKKATALIPQIVNKKFLNSISKQAKTDLAFNDMVTLTSNYRKALKNIKSDSVQGTDYEYSGISYQVVASKEKQRVTNKIRKFLGLKKAKSGPLYASKVTNGVVIGDDSSTETDDSTTTYSSSTQQTYTTPATTYSSSSVQPTAPTTDTTTTNNNTGGQ